jgi:hypothetical protein
MGTRAPDLLELGRRNIGAVVRSDGSPELLTASLVDGAKALSVDDLWLVSDLGVDAKGVEGLWRVAGSEWARLWQEDLVLVAPRRGSDGSSSVLGAASGVAHGGAVAR